jgi:hypothetical protein
LDLAQSVQVSVVRTAGEMERRHLPALWRRYEIPASHRSQHAATQARQSSEAAQPAGPLAPQSRLKKRRTALVETWTRTRIHLRRFAQDIA